MPGSGRGMRDRFGLGGTSVSKTFESFDAEAQPKAYAAAKAFMDDRQSLLFHGPNGIGKTHLALAIANALLDKHGVASAVVCFTTLDDALRQLRTTYKDGYVGMDESFYIDRWRTMPVLILDDVGQKGRLKPSGTGEFGRRIAYDIIDGRYRLGNKPIIVTTNKTPGQLGEWITESATDRLFEMGRVIQMEGKSWRRK